jgi:hypothetical protein
MPASQKTKLKEAARESIRQDPSSLSLLLSNNDCEKEIQGILYQEVPHKVPEIEKCHSYCCKTSSGGKGEKMAAISLISGTLIMWSN